MTSSESCSPGDVESNYIYANIENCGCELFIPNAISPNGDQANDAWFIGGLDCWDMWTVRVYNRYGSLVWEQFKGGTKGDLYIPWDGYRNGKPMPVAVYYYVIEVSLKGEKPKDYTGPLTIMR